MRAGASSCVEDHRINRLIADRGPATCGTNTIGYWQVPGLQEKSTMGSRLLSRSIVLLLTLWSVASFAAVTPYPPYPGAKPSPAFKVPGDGEPVFAHGRHVSRLGGSRPGGLRVEGVRGRRHVRPVARQ